MLHRSNHLIRRPAVVLLLALALAFAGAASTTAATWKIDPVHSSAIFKIKHFNTSNFYGAFKTMTGTVEYDPAKPEASSIDITIKAESVDSRMEQRDTHIKSPDFLNSAQFPTISFKSTSVKSNSDGSLEVTGNLTLLGITKPVSAQVEKTGEGTNPRSQKDILGFEAHFTVDRTAHDMNFMAGPLSREIGFILALELVKE